MVSGDRSLRSAQQRQRVCRLHEDIKALPAVHNLEAVAATNVDVPDCQASVSPEQNSRDMAAVAYELRETNAAHAHELAKTMGGLHARYFRLCLRCRSPQAALNYAALLPRSEKLHGCLMNEIAKHGTDEVVQAALDLRDHLGIPMDKCASVAERLPM